jgi:hypothetical protein
MRVHQPGCQLYALLRSRTNLSGLGAYEASTSGALYFPPIRAILEHSSVESYDALSSR